MGRFEGKPKAGQFDIVLQTGAGYIIVDAVGRKVGGFYASRSSASTRLQALQREADASAQRMIRPCLCCQTRFMSEGKHNRMCDRCRQQSGGMV